jgi:hypothetical protein
MRHRETGNLVEKKLRGARANYGKEVETDEDLRAMMRHAGWRNLRELPLRIDMNDTRNEFGGDRLVDGLGTLLRGEGYHRQMRRKYQKAASWFWLPVPPDSPERGERP